MTLMEDQVMLHVVSLCFRLLKLFECRWTLFQIGRLIWNGWSVGRSGDDSGRLNRSRCKYDRDNEDNDERDRRRHSRSYNDNERDGKRRRSRSSRSRSRSRSQSRSLSPHSNERKDTSKPIDTKVSGIQLKLITPASVGASPKPTLVSTSKPSSAPALVSNVRNHFDLCSQRFMPLLLRCKLITTFNYRNLLRSLRLRAFLQMMTMMSPKKCHQSVAWEWRMWEGNDFVLWPK